MAATMTQIAKEAGVSVAVVSRLVRGDPKLRISPECREQIMRIKERHGGVRSRVHKGKQQRTGTILAPVNRIYSSAWVGQNLQSSEFIRHFEAGLQPHGLKLHFSFFDESDAKSYFESLIWSRTQCDGMLALSGVMTPWLAEQLRACELPHISEDFNAERLGVNTVRPHFSHGVLQAVEHLIQLGHRRIGFVGCRHHYRYPMVVSAMSAHHLPLDGEFHCWFDKLAPERPETNWRDHIAKGFGRYLDDGYAGTAVVCTNDYLALGVIDAMRERGLEPGRDLSVIGNDNLEEREDLSEGDPILTTVDNPTDLLGRRAAESIMGQINRVQTQIIHERIPVNLIVRGSTGPCLESD